MDSRDTLSTLANYKDELSGILSRFSHDRDSIHIDHNDDPRFRQIVIELRDFLNDTLGTKNSYSSMIVQFFNEGIGNFVGSPSFKSVENIIGVVSSIITRITRNPEILSDVSNSNLSSAIKKKEKRFSDVMSKKFSLKNNEIWSEIEKEYDLTKRGFGRKINFVSNKFIREIIFRDVGQAYMLAKIGFPKPAVILAGSIIEELLRLYLKHKKITISKKTFDGYIQACKDNTLLKSAVYTLTDSVRHFRNHVHLAKESNKKHTISKATAKGAVASIFTLVNDFD